MAQEQAVKFRVHPTKLRTRKIAILGFTEHRKMAFKLPHDQWERWGLNELHRYEDIKEFDRWVEIHPRVDLEGDQEHIKGMAAMDIPVYMHQHWSDIPASMPFPKAEVEQLAGKYMTSTPAWELGLAILLLAQEPMTGEEEIAVVGIDMAQETEYAEQRPCVEYLIGLARGMGIRVNIPQTSDLLKAVGQYGFGEEAHAFRAKLTERIKWLHGQDNDWLAQIRGLDAEYSRKKEQLEADYRNKRDQLAANRWQTMGAIQDCEFWKRSWSVPDDSKPGEPTPDRTADPKTGIVAQSGDTAKDRPAPPVPEGVKQRVVEGIIAERKEAVKA